MKIVKAVKRWRECNGFTVEEIAGVLESIRLSQMSPEDLKEVVSPCGLYSQSVLDSACCKKEKGAIGTKPRGYIGKGPFCFFCFLLCFFLFVFCFCS